MRVCIYIYIHIYIYIYVSYYEVGPYRGQVYMLLMSSLAALQPLHRVQIHYVVIED